MSYNFCFCRKNRKNVNHAVILWCFEFGANLQSKHTKKTWLSKSLHNCKIGVWFGFAVQSMVSLELLSMILTFSKTVDDGSTFHALHSCEQCCGKVHKYSVESSIGHTDKENYSRKGTMHDRVMSYNLSWEEVTTERAYLDAP